MLPSLLARDIKVGLKQFLTASYEPGDSFFNGVMRRFVYEDEAAWLKGPYVQVGLPYVPGTKERNFFAKFQTQYPGHDHQERAWVRLSTQHKGASTLIATGTGSGKTECFLYPVLDHCARARATGEPGIKALVIYPMNALATDQARRIAELVDSIAAFKGLRVGLYVGGAGGMPGQGIVMTPTSVITDRDTLRKNPPDILLTNYKMLDYLMLRPKDRALWASNGPSTLRYVVVDELHTFDGAQGTDLALLLRRLRARLRIPADHLICAGTSATLGSASDTAPLRDYARQIFGVTFDPASVITENRLSVSTFLDAATVDYMFLVQAAVFDTLESERYDTPEEAIRAWFPLFFGGEIAPADITDKDWRRRLGEKLKRHQLFVNLLKLLRDGVVPYSELMQAFARTMPSATPGQVERVLDALLVLVAWALRDGNLPLVTLRLQLWLRELRRMVSRLGKVSQEIRLMAERDLPADRSGIHLPLLQCNQCRTTGWLSRLAPGQQKVSTELERIYETWFGRKPETVRLYAAESVSGDHVNGIDQQICTSCGTLQRNDDACVACGHRELLTVFRVSTTRTVTRGQAQIVRHDDTCPSCGDTGSLILLGARNATLGSQIIDASWASLFNDDKKLIAFSDSVQDAAHRAGFFGARTWQNNVRTAWAHALDAMNANGQPWSHVLALAEQQFEIAGSALHMGPEALVAEFLAPDMTWQWDWADLKTQHALPKGSRLPQKVRNRLLWQLFSDLTYQSQRGRTLERVGKAALTVPWERVERIAREVLPFYRERLGIRQVAVERLTQWLWGTLVHMRQRGGVMHPAMASYVPDGNVWLLARGGGRGEWMPRMGDRTPRPQFLSLGTHPRFDRMKGTNTRTWYEKWGYACLKTEVLLSLQQLADMYEEAFRVMTADGILVVTDHHSGPVIGLASDALVLSSDLAYIASKGRTRRLAVPRADAERLLGMPSLEDLTTAYTEMIPDPADWWATRFSRGDVKRVIAAEHTGLLGREEREALETRFKAKAPKPWYENLLSATPTLEMGVDIGDLSSVLLCSVPPNQASFLQRIGRAGRRDGNAMTTTLADGNSPHDLYFFAETEEMIAGTVEPPGVFLKAVEVLRRQLLAFCIDDWVAGLTNLNALPEKTSTALDAVEQAKTDRFPYLFLDHVVRNQQRLFDSFVALLGSDADGVVTQRLLDFIEGQGQEDGLKIRLMKSLEDLAKERSGWKKRKDEIDRLRARAQQKPQDEATKNEIEQLTRERDKALELIKEINGRELLNTLTDAGLIPNYAFPETGVELKSVLWRRRGEDEPGTGKYVTLGAQTFERPANSALSEFAPENRFFANQRRVEIDQINMSLTNTEEWRFCPSCHHVQNLAISADVHKTCPHCADPMWADGAQKRTLLRFRQAIANSNDEEARIDDSAEDREPNFYTRQLLANFEPTAVQEAWQLPAGGTAFGFEFLSQVKFRDVNFGDTTKPGQSFKVADREATRPGFKLCRQCGKVQTPPRRGEDPARQLHSLDCSDRESKDPAKLFDCLYLYREFTSEALRILVPFTKYGVDEKVIQSFMAAVQLGLKRCFGGKVDHLRMTLQDEPGTNGGPRRQYVMLYDSVPGGTGYLNELLKYNADALDRVFTEALSALKTCRCNQDPEQDGCYRCLYQYRLGRNMEKVSREVAKNVLGELVGSLTAKERVATISQIYINPNFDSVLESRFIESLRKLGGLGSLPPVTLVQDVVYGKSGYVLQVGTQRYRVEPQRNTRPSDGVAVASRPDFVIWPWSERSPRKPVAIFCDGWTYHKSTMREDAQKRSALAASGKFWTWSVTHEDVAKALDGRQETDLDSPTITLKRHDGSTLFGDGSKPLSWFHSSELQTLSHNAVAQLLSFLSAPGDGTTEKGSLKRNACWLTYLTFPTNQQQLEAVKSQMTEWLHRLPPSVKQQPNAARMMSQKESKVTVLGWWPLELIKPSLPAGAWSAPGIVAIDEAQQDNETEFHLTWRQWLQTFNVVQFLPGMLLTTVKGLEERDYELLEGSSIGARGQAASASLTARDPAWAGALNSCVGYLSEPLSSIADAGAVAPEVGLELENAKGESAADCELAWREKKIVVLRPDQEDLASIWTAAGWTVLVLRDGIALADNQPLVPTLAQVLGLPLSNIEE
jgi:DEAD/DEAH box helicase domain-containing protein